MLQYWNIDCLSHKKLGILTKPSIIYGNFMMSPVNWQATHPKPFYLHLNSYFIDGNKSLHYTLVMMRSLGGSGWEKLVRTLINFGLFPSAQLDFFYIIQPVHNINYSWLAIFHGQVNIDVYKLFPLLIENDMTFAWINVDLLCGFIFL